MIDLQEGKAIAMDKDDKEKIIYFDFTPDPQVLVALSHTSMSPLDALCELIDNSIDGFDVAKLQGIDITKPVIYIDLPKKADVDKGIGVLRIRDNGPGMTPEQAEHAIKAGYSGNNSIDRLGLFGMGFNISTSKFGRVTIFSTARIEDDLSTSVVIDLEKISQTKSYQIEAVRSPKTAEFKNGTIIEIKGWWPEGNANNGFIKKLINYRFPKIREQLGRRYATILREKKVNIILNGEPCEAYEHCVWDSSRYVERNGQKIPARYDFDEVVGSKRRCSKCRAILPDNYTECPNCHSTEIRTVEEHVKGWVGIQRYDDASDFGIDLIRNGRAIRIAEKTAFFEYVDEFSKESIKDYPIDSPYGRIVGEVHLNFVPVDFLKQDFQRSSDEWAKAMKVLRGESSLQPRQDGADKNNSYLYKLYQGYRKVRTPGKTDLYMGYWDVAEGKPKRIARSVEEEYKEKFRKHIPGFYDDAEWYKLVEEASQPPVQELVECPDCLTQNLKEAEVCVGCGKVLIGKRCINEKCGAFIPKSAVVCEHCGTSQIPKIVTPWVCNVCGTKNNSTDLFCAKCGTEKGAENPVSQEYLLKNSNKDDSYSISNLDITLADGKDSMKIELATYVTKNPIISPLTQNRIPLVVFKDISSLNVFIDLTHPMFTNSNIPIEGIIATEVAQYLYSTNMNLVNYPEHTISRIEWQIINKYWEERVKLNRDSVERSCASLLKTIKERLAGIISSDQANTIVHQLTGEQQKELIYNLISENHSVDEISELAKSGEIVLYIPNDTLLDIYEESPELFFNNNVWKIAYNVDNPLFNAEVLKATYDQVLKEYHNTLESIVIYENNPNADTVTLKKINAAIDFLTSNLGEQL